MPCAETENMKQVQKSRLKKRLDLKRIRKSGLLDLGFLELNMLFGNRIVFAFDHLFGHCTAVFLGDIKETSVCGALKLYLNSGGFCHNVNPVSEACKLSCKAVQEGKIKQAAQAAIC